MVTLRKLTPLSVTFDGKVHPFEGGRNPQERAVVHVVAVYSNGDRVFRQMIVTRERGNQILHKGSLL